MRKQKAPPNSVLHTKLMPPRLRTSAVPRQALLEKLDHSLDKKLAVVSAPTGFGKTTLVSMWIASRDVSSAWLTLDEHDNDPARFWTYFISALRTVDSTMGKSALAALNVPTSPSFQILLTPLINDLSQRREPCVLVLEDFHWITSSDIHDGLSFLIQHLPDSLHLIVITRSNPNLSMHLLRARHECIEIDTLDLRFSLEETEEFLRTTAKAQVSASAVTSLFQKTEGWIAGLQLAVSSLQNKNAEDSQNLVQNFSGSHRYISDYLVKEVFENQPAPVQEFLLKTCFLKTLTASLCDATAGIVNSATLLEQLEREHLFLIRLGQGSGNLWYRFNPLFAEFMQFLSRQRLHEEVLQQLFERASDWYEYHGLLEDAIETALHANVYARAIHLIEKYIEIHDLRELRTLARWLEILPRQDLLQRPILCFTFAQILLYSGDRFAPATGLQLEPYLQAAESIWRKEENHPCLGQLLSFRGNVQWWQGDFHKSFEYARQSLAELLEQDVFWRGNSLLILSYEALNDGRVLDAQDLILEARALLGAAQNNYGVLAALQLLSEVFYLQGELEQSEQLNYQIQTDALGEDSMLDDQGIAALSLAHIAYEKNDLERSDELAGRAFELGKQRSNEILQVQATVRRSQICAVRGDWAAAQEFIKSMQSQIQNPALLRELQNAGAQLSIREGKISQLDWWIKMVSADQPGVMHLQKERNAFLQARLQIAENKLQEALKSVLYWKADAAENGRIRSQVEASLLEALVYFADSNLPGARDALSESMTLGQSRGLRRIFLDEGSRLAALLQAILPMLPNRSLNLFATTLLHSFPAGTMTDITGSGSTLQVDALSQQELRVLRLLVAGMSNGEIAQELVVSNNTVKTHVKSIYRKLNISSREEARWIAKELKLL